MAYNQQKGIRQIIEKAGSMRVAETVNNRGKIIEESLKRNVLQMLGLGKKIIQNNGNVVCYVHDNSGSQIFGRYLFVKINDSQVAITINDNDSITYDIPDNDILVELGFLIKLNSYANIGDYQVMIINKAIKYRGGSIAYADNNLTIGASLLEVMGIDIGVDPYTATLIVPLNTKKIIVLKCKLEEIEYTDEPEILGQYIANINSYSPNSPGAIQIQTSHVTYSNYSEIPETTDTVTYIVSVILENTDGVIETFDCMNNVNDVIQNDTVIYKYFNDLQLSKIKSITDKLVINMGDGEGDRTILTEKIPSIPNTITAITKVVKPISYTPSLSITEAVNLRTVNKINLSSLTTNVTLLTDLKTLASVSTQSSDLINKIDECISTGALTSVEGAEYKTKTPAEVVTALGDSSSGKIGEKVSERTVTNNNIIVQEKFIYEQTQGVAEESQTTEGKLTVNWNEPDKVDNEEIIGYKIKGYILKESFNQTSETLIDSNITNPLLFTSAINIKDYIKQENPTIDSDKKRYTVVDNSKVWVRDVDIESIDIKVQSNEKVVLYIATVSEYSIVSDWSNPFVIDIPNIIVDTDNDTTFKNYDDTRKEMASIRKDVEQSIMTNQINENQFENQLSISQKVDTSTLNEKISQVTT